MQQGDLEIQIGEGRSIRCATKPWDHLLHFYCRSVSSSYKRPKRRCCIPSNPTQFPHQFFKRGFLLGPFRLQVNFSSLLPGNIWNCSLLRTPSPSVYGTQGFPNSILFNHSGVCPQPLPKRVLHRVRFSASSLNVQYSLSSSSSSSSCLRTLHRLPVTSVIPSIFPSIRCFRRRFQMVPQFVNTDDYASFLNEIRISANSCP